MKKFLKVFIIILLIGAAVCGTCYIFFRNLKKNQHKTESIAEVLVSDTKKEFNSNLRSLSAVVNSDSTDNRIDLIVQTSEKLDEIIYVLSTYFVDTQTVLNDKEISNSLDEILASRKLLSAMMKEYNIKKDSAYFNRHLGVNDFYKQVGSYLIKYAGLANLLNEHVSVVDKNADLKFSMFEIYSNVVQLTFSDIDKNANDRLMVKDDLNITLLNDIMEIENGFIVTHCEQFSKYTNLFNKYYNSCNKTTFAKQLKSNVNSTISLSDTSNERLATYYFKIIYGI